MVASILPIELYEHAIDSLGDEESLKATSLVCRAWLPRSRLNLFRVIELSLPGHLDRLAGLLSHAPHLAEYVEEIDISENSFLGVLRPAQTIAARLPVMLSAHSLVQPRLLTVHDQVWLPTRYDPDYLFSLSRLSFITSLDLYDVVFPTLADFSIILRALSQLTSLSVKHLDCHRQMDPETASDIGCVLPSLTFLRASSYHPTTVVDWLFRHVSMPSLRSLECEYEFSHPDNRQALGELWENTGYTLEDVSINITKRSAGTRRLAFEVIEQQIDLSPCRILRTLRFDCRQERGAVPDWTWLAWLLSHLTCRTLRTITFAFESSSHALASMHAFAEELDRVLTSALFSDGLESVIFEFAYSDAANPDDKRFLDAFPTLRDSRLLKVCNLDQQSLL